SQNPKEKTQAPKDKELWSDEVKRIVAETSTKRQQTQQETSEYIRIDDSDAEMEETETGNNN
ncbi:3597_t:CDS:1, partial [Acaulospora morrowiae]